jgi:hypothetical protein
MSIDRDKERKREGKGVTYTSFTRDSKYVACKKQLGNVYMIPFQTAPLPLSPFIEPLLKR